MTTCFGPCTGPSSGLSVFQETIQCTIYIAISSNEISLIKWPLIIVNKNKYYKIKIISCIKYSL